MILIDVEMQCARAPKHVVNICFLAKETLQCAVLKNCCCMGTTDLKAHFFAILENQIQTLKKCLCCHIYCAQLWAHLGAIATASCTVSNRYPRPESTSKLFLCTHISISAVHSTIIFRFLVQFFPPNAPSFLVSARYTK